MNIICLHLENSQRAVNVNIKPHKSGCGRPVKNKENTKSLNGFYLHFHCVPSAFDLMFNEEKLHAQFLNVPL